MKRIFIASFLVFALLLTACAVTDNNVSESDSSIVESKDDINSAASADNDSSAVVDTTSANSGNESSQTSDNSENSDNSESSDNTASDTSGNEESSGSGNSGNSGSSGSGNSGSDNGSSGNSGSGNEGYIKIKGYKNWEEFEKTFYTDGEAHPDFSKIEEIFDVDHYRKSRYPEFDKQFGIEGGGFIINVCLLPDEYKDYNALQLFPEYVDFEWETYKNPVVCDPDDFKAGSNIYKYSKSGVDIYTTRAVPHNGITYNIFFKIGNYFFFIDSVKLLGDEYTDKREGDHGFVSEEIYIEMEPLFDGCEGIYELFYVWHDKSEMIDILKEAISEAK